MSSLSGIDYSKYSNYFGNSKSSGGKSLATPLSGSVGKYDGNTYKANGRTWTGAEAKQMYAYDQKRYSTSPTVRASAASYGKSLHNNLWGATLKRNNELARTRVMSGSLGTYNGNTYRANGRT